MSAHCLLGTIAHHAHIQQIAGGLHEARALAQWCVAGAVADPSPLSILLARADRRRITTVPASVVESHWGWESARLAATRAGLTTLGDRLWECGERALDRHCARLLQRSRFTAFLGVEHGALESLRAARRLGKRGGVVFTSPHHAFRARWVDAEYARDPALLTPATKRALALGRRRDRRRDAEMAEADVILAVSDLVAQSLRDAGVPPNKLVVVPPGAPPAIAPHELPTRLARPLRIIAAGPCSVRKGAHHLLAAWPRVAPGRHAELHWYGERLLPPAYAASSAGITFHGSVPPAALRAAYRDGAILVFPTRCDGFGLVVLEAMAQGLPVITTSNAGAASFVRDGENGFVVPPGDENALAQRLTWCLEHPEALLAMRAAARDTAARWTGETFRATLTQRLLPRLAP